MGAVLAGRPYFMALRPRPDELAQANAAGMGKDRAMTAR